MIRPIVLFFAIGGIAFFIRRRKRQQDSPLPHTVDTKEKDGFLQENTQLQDKAQLHSDSLVRHELDGAAPEREPSELPVAERAGELEQTA
jgi:hypothetical protein